MKKQVKNIYFCLSFYLPSYLPTHPRTHPPTYLSVCLCFYLPTYLPTCLSVFLSTCLPTYLPTTYLPTYLPTSLAAYLPALLPTYIYLCTCHQFEHNVKYSATALLCADNRHQKKGMSVYIVFWAFFFSPGANASTKHCQFPTRLGSVCIQLTTEKKKASRSVFCDTAAFLIAREEVKECFVTRLFW